MKTKSNTWTIVKKEFARFFGDRQLFFTAVIMPGLLIYLIYSVMGIGISKMITDGSNNTVDLYVENMPASLEPAIAMLDSAMVVKEQTDGVLEMLPLLDDEETNIVLLRFPQGFDSLTAAYQPQSGELAPNVEIYYNSVNNASSRVYYALTAMLTAYEDSMSNRFDVNRADTEEQKFDQASADQILGDIWSKLLPMLIVMMLFSGVMSIAPSSIAGEKERGTIATLLVTPMNRSELAIGKIISLSVLSLLSGLSSFIGIVLSIPKMVHGEAHDLDLAFNYTFGDYAALLLIIFGTVIIMASVVSLLSAFAKDVKNAGTMVLPLMMVVLFAGLMPMFQSGTPASITTYLIPFYNSIETMVGVFDHSLQWSAVMTTVCSNLVYSAMAVWGLTYMFNNEKIMFGR
ncbi:MAG: ABC transporter permease [Bacteroidales bacterium]|nr:ABC transporter permease [Bacteroidales bacterium]